MDANITKYYNKFVMFSCEVIITNKSIGNVDQTL